MYCLTNICYVCLKKKNNLISNVNSSVSVNKELRRIIGYYAFNLPWLKTKRIILICEECYSQLHETYQFLKMWHRNSSLLQGYIDLLNTTTMSNTDNEAELHVHVNMKQADINEVKREVKLEDEQTFQWEHNIQETEVALVDFEYSPIKEIICKRIKVDETETCPPVNYSTEIVEETNEFVKEDNKPIREAVDDTEEYPMNNNFTESMNNESASEISVNVNAHVTNTASVNSGFTGKQMCTTNMNDLNTSTKNSYKCSTCSKSFITKTELNIHTRIHIDRKLYECDICKNRFNHNKHLVVHMRTHTGEKPYECAQCKKCFSTKSNLICHMRTHTGEKPYECTTCKRCFTQHITLIRHIRTHTGEKPYECTICKHGFACHSYLTTHMRIHTGEKPYKCSKCNEYFRQKSTVNMHMRNKHRDEDPH